MLEFLVLFAFWLLLSGHYKIKYILIGAFSAAVVTFLTSDLFHTQVQRHGEGDEGEVVVDLAAIRLWRFVAYIPWLVYSIITANIQVAMLILNPRLPIDPAFIQFKTGFRRTASQVTLANSITLTPGTVTVDLVDGGYVVHAIVPGSAESLVTGEMQGRVAAVFGEAKEKAPAVLWVHSIEELKR